MEKARKLLEYSWNFIAGFEWPPSIRYYGVVLIKWMQVLAFVGCE